MAKNAGRLALMMFLQYGGLGAWIVPLTRWLRRGPEHGGLDFSPADVVWMYSTLAVGGFLAPLVTGILADRTFHSNKLIAWLNALMATLCLAAGYWGHIHSGERADPEAAFWPLFLLLLVYSVAIMVGIVSGTAMTLRALADPARQFGQVRLVGTLGWVVTVAFVGGVLNPISADPFLVAAICHGLLATGLIWLPPTPPLGKGRPLAEVIGLPAIRLFRDRSFLIFVLVAFTAHTMQQFYTIFAVECCFRRGMPMPEVVMTSSQFVEMACMAAIPFMVHRFGLKVTMAVGISAWAVRNAIFLGDSWLLLAFIGVPLQGLAFSFFTIVGSLYIDREAPPHLRAGAQGLLTFFCSGPGNLIGNIITRYVVEANTVNDRVQWFDFWLVPTIVCSVAAVVFIVCFHEPQRTA